jgi:2-oxoglutarate ferredoxin oxidoreductase subunit alpha
MTVTAFNFAEKYRSPVILLLDEITAHTREKIALPDPSEFEIFNRLVPTMPPEWYKPYEETMRGVPPLPPLGAGYRSHVTGLAHDALGFPTERTDEIKTLMDRLFRKIDQFYPDLMLVEEKHTADAEVAVIAYGSVARSAEMAVEQAREAGIRAGLMKLKTLFPFPRPHIERLARSCRALIVPEMNLGQMSREVKRVASGLTKIRTINRVDGQIVSPAQILKSISQE